MSAAAGKRVSRAAKEYVNGMDFTSEEFNAVKTMTAAARDKV
jgi:hypothetical protein